MPTDEAHLWEQGCRTDEIRNRFLVPAIAATLESRRANRILDVGCGTGYMARQIEARLSYRPQWTLIDINPGRLLLCEELKPRASDHTIQHCDIVALRCEKLFDAALLTFTLVEIANVDGCLAAIANCLKLGASLIIALPDGWEDAFQQLPDATPLRSLLQGKVALQKIDKFTDAPYPFCAIRIESAVEKCLNAGFVLTDLVRSVGCPSSAYLLHFIRSDRGI